MIKNILGSLVFVAAVFALVNFIGDVMVNPDTAPRQTPIAKGEPVAAQKAAAEAAKAEAEAPVSVSDLTGDADNGKKLFRKSCMGCHTIGKGEPNRTGPNLWAVVGRDKASAEGFRYSSSMQAKGGQWTEEDLSAFIAGPRTFVPDTKMTFKGIKKAQQRADVIAFLNALKD